MLHINCLLRAQPGARAGTANECWTWCQHRRHPLAPHPCPLAPHPCPLPSGNSAAPTKLLPVLGPDTTQGRLFLLIPFSGQGQSNEDTQCANPCCRIPSQNSHRTFFKVLFCCPGLAQSLGAVPVCREIHEAIGKQRSARVSQVLKENLKNVPHFDGCACAIPVCRVTSHLSSAGWSLDTIFAPVWMTVTSGSGFHPGFRAPSPHTSWLGIPPPVLYHTGGCHQQI